MMIQMWSLSITNPYNAMRITQGYAYHNGHIKNVQFGGIQGICQECTTRPFENNEVNISMLCSGTRCVAQWQKDELAIGIPFNKLSLHCRWVKKYIEPYGSKS